MVFIVELFTYKQKNGSYTIRNQYIINLCNLLTDWNASFSNLKKTTRYAENKREKGKTLSKQIFICLFGFNIKALSTLKQNILTEYAKIFLKLDGQKI